MNQVKKHIYVLLRSRNQIRVFSSKCVDKKTKKCPNENEHSKKKSEENSDEQQEEKGSSNIKKAEDVKKINVGIIGGGMTAMYTAVLLKQCGFIKRVHLLDTTDSLRCMLQDASHIDTSTKLKYYKREYARDALKNVDIVALMDQDDCNLENVHKEDLPARFNASSNYVRAAAQKIIEFCPDAFVAVFARPVTATLPMVTEIYRCAGCWCPDRIIGSTSLECMRLEAMTARLSDLNPCYLSVPMVGGADPETIVPLLSCARPANYFTREQKQILLRSLRTADQELSKSKLKNASLTTSTAACKFISVLVAGLRGYENVVACAYVRSNALPACHFFTTELQFGAEGVQKNFGVPKISSSEISLVEQAIPCINRHVEMGITAVRNGKIARLCS